MADSGLEPAERYRAHPPLLAPLPQLAHDDVQGPDLCVRVRRCEMEVRVDWRGGGPTRVNSVRSMVRPA